MSIKKIKNIESIKISSSYISSHLYYVIVDFDIEDPTLQEYILHKLIYENVNYETMKITGIKVVGSDLTLRQCGSGFIITELNITSNMIYCEDKDLKILYQGRELTWHRI